MPDHPVPDHPPATRVLVVDDQELVRSGIALILSHEDDLQIVGERSDGDQVLAAIASLHPDVILLDVRMARMDGADVLRALAHLGSAPPVLVLTTFSDDDVLWGTLDAGAVGFVLKDSPAADILRAVRTVAAGGSWLDPTVTPRVLAAVRSRPTADPDAQARIATLTDRELQVLRAVARGATNTEIAAALFVSERTVKAHISALFLKLDVRHRAAAIVVAHDAHLPA